MIAPESELCYIEGTREVTDAMFERYDTLRNAPMRDYTTLRLGGPAEYLAFPKTVEEIRGLLAEAADRGIPVTVIGHGSNLLVLDGGIRGLVIRFGKTFREIGIQGDRLSVQAGVMLGNAARAAAEAGLSGMEFAAGIPGTLGGAVTMNAGAYDGDMSRITERVDGILPDGTAVSLPAEEMRFGYRTSAAAALGLIVTRVTLRLLPGEPDRILDRMTELNRRRAEKQPLDVPSAGSTFKRPENGFAAALIDQCGLKGFRIGGARVSEKHAGFLVNTGESSADYLALVRYVQKTVLERAGVKLEPEIRIIGEE